MFLASSRNSVAAQIQLLKKLNCKCLLSLAPRPLLVTAILTTYEISMLQVTSVRELHGVKLPHYVFVMDAEEEKIDRPLFVV